MRIHPVILCGGTGTRLWPLSRKSYPKQFVRLLGDKSLFQASAQRLSGNGFAPPMVLTNSDFRFVVTEQLADVGIDPGPVLIEPSGQDTAPAILAAALWLEQTDPDALMLIAPSDHVIPDTADFKAAVRLAAETAVSGRLITFGIQPDRPETGYGYLETNTPITKDTANQAHPLVRFVEKPDADTAKTMLEAGTFLWNAGIFLFSVRAILDAFERHAPDLFPPVRKAVADSRTDLGFVRLDPEGFGAAEAISIDYAIMERADNLSVVPYMGGWSDLGSWEAVLRECDHDAAGVATSGPVTAIDCETSLLRSESENLHLVGIGLKDVIAVAMPDAVLIADANKTQDVKRAVSILKTQGIGQATQLPRDYRPWGWYESLVIGERFQVKRIHVHPGAALSLQSHVHRSEHWIVVQGTARVTIDETVSLVTENQSVYIPLGAVHRMENPGKVDMVLIEVQTGIYLGENDIIRYEDIYARG